MDITKKLNLHVLIAAAMVVAVLFVTGLSRLEIDTDIIKSLPQKDQVISDAVYLLNKHPMQGQVTIDIGLKLSDTELLIDCGDLVETRLRQSGLFKSVGMRDFQGLMPKFISHVLANLPVLFTEKELHRDIKPLLMPEKISEKLREIHANLLALEGIGQAEIFSKDPLALRNSVLVRLSLLAPNPNIRMVRGKLISPDGLHLLVIAKPKASSADTGFARKVTDLINKISNDLTQKHADSNNRVTLTAMGAYRAALDNELLIRQDVKKAILLATTGIALLLLFAFPRPWMGLLSLMPAIMGAMTAFFVYSIFLKSISIMVLGFGGAIISISVDHGISYMLFLDRPHRTSGREASREVRAIGLLATLTTVGAFGTLCFSDFPVFFQLGVFTALGILFSFLFVHTVFPIVFKSIGPARPRKLPVQALVNQFSHTGTKGAYVALAFVIVMSFFAKPDFNSRLDTMNTMSGKTLDAEGLFIDVWGEGLDKVFLMTEAKTITGLQDKSDILLEMMERDADAGIADSIFMPSMIFPGEARQRKNFHAWKNFWNRERQEQLKVSMLRAAGKLGFREDAFNPFLGAIRRAAFPFGKTDIPRDLLEFTGSSSNPDNSGWFNLSTITRGRQYNPDRFYGRHSNVARVFDPGFFSEHLGQLLFSTFMKILIIVGFSVVGLVLFFFLNLKLTLIVLLPVAFALISSLGTLKIIGHPVDIPGLMLSVVVLGMGIDYSLFFVRSYQRYQDMSHHFFKLIRTAVFMSAASTLIGFGALCLARHSLLRSAGLISILGIGYSLIGAFVILPPVLKRVFQDDIKKPVRKVRPEDRVLARYRKAEAYPRMFVRFKMKLDPMFRELIGFFDSSQKIKTVIDIGTGYGVPACLVLEQFPGARVYGLEPDPDRVRIANQAIGKNGGIYLGRAPDLPLVVPDTVEVVMMLDMLHYLDDNGLRSTLDKIRPYILLNGRLIIRVVAPQKKSFPLLLWMEKTHLKFTGGKAFYRSTDEIKAIMIRSYFRVDLISPSGSSGELFWIIARPQSRRSL
jgi:predicted exporter